MQQPAQVRALEAVAAEITGVDIDAEGLGFLGRHCWHSLESAWSSQKQVEAHFVRPRLHHRLVDYNFTARFHWGC